MSRIELTWRELAGRSHVFHIHQAPRDISAKSVGHVPSLMPQGRELEIIERMHRLRDPERYQLLMLALRDHYLRRMEGLLEAGALAPGGLQAFFRDERPLPDGAQVVCTCPPERAHRGLCHRWWAAPFLARAGWEVTVDGYRPGTLREYSRVTSDPAEEFGYHLADLETDGFTLQRTRELQHPRPDWSWWRFGVLIRSREGQEVGRIWVEDPEQSIAASKALMGLRVWATHHFKEKRRFL